MLGEIIVFGSLLLDHTGGSRRRKYDMLETRIENAFYKIKKRQEREDRICSREGGQETLLKIRNVQAIWKEQRRIAYRIKIQKEYEEKERIRIIWFLIFIAVTLGLPGLSLISLLW